MINDRETGEPTGLRAYWTGQTFQPIKEHSNKSGDLTPAQLISAQNAYERTMKTLQDPNLAPDVFTKLTGIQKRREKMMAPAIAAPVAPAIAKPTTPAPVPGTQSTEITLPGGITAKKGDVKRQNGHIYEFDGASWKPIQ